MITVGITGGIGSGKTTIANYFSSEFGIPVYYADTEAKALMNTEALQNPIKKLLGEASYVNGKLDRKYVAGKVFKDQEALEQLNQIVHPAVGKHFKKWCTRQDAPYVLKEAAILNRMNKQWDDEKKIPLADFVIENIDLDNSKIQTENIHRQILRDRVNT